MSVSVFLLCVVALQELIINNKSLLDSKGITIEQLLADLQSATYIQEVMSYEDLVRVVPDYVSDIRTSKPFVDLSLEEERFIYELFRLNKLKIL